MKYTAMGFNSFGQPDVFEKMELELPLPAENQLVIEIDASSVNFSDIQSRKGKYSMSGPPYIPGLDFTGRVISAGSIRNKDMVGKRVVGFGDTGSYATMALVDIDLTFTIPDDISLLTAAAAPLLIGTTYALLTQHSGVTFNSRIVIHAAAGGIGLTAIQLARKLGAKQIIGLVSSSDKTQAVLEAGATNVVVTTETSNYADTLKQIAPNGIDYILNSVAGDTVQTDLEILESGGQLVVFGMASGFPGTITSDQLHHTSKTVTGFSFGHLRRTNPKQAAEIMEKALPLVFNGDVTFPHVTSMSLYDVAKAHAAIESRSSIGKIVLIP